MTSPAHQLPSLEGTPWAELEIDRDLVDIPEMLMRASQKWSDQTAWHFVETGREIRFSELADQVLRVAGALKATGVSAGDRVGIMLANVPEFPLAWLAIAALNAVSVPLNPAYTAREMAFILEDTGLTHLVIGEAELPIWDEASKDFGPFPVDSTRTFVVGRRPPGYGPGFDELSSGALAPPILPEVIDPESTATILFTSGTTGLPKGCVLTHAYWVTTARTSCAIVGPIRNILADHPFYYLQNQYYLMKALASGARLVVTPGLSLSRYVELLWDYDIDFAWISQRLQTRPPSPRDRGHKLRRAPADQLVPDTHAALEQRFGVTVREWYGSTEAGLGTLVPWDDDGSTGSGSIGIAGPFRETKIVDEQLRELASGEIGELCLRGPGMMTGYFNRPDTNKELFIDGGWFRTGDLCMKDDRGHHFFQGRLKDVIRRSGEQIAAQEVEHVLAGFAGIVKVGVVPVPDPRRGEEAKAYIVLADPAAGTAAKAEEILAFCRERLAGFKIPRYLEFRQDLPFTSSGKVAKAVLRSEKPDLRIDSFDANTGIFISA